MIFKATFNITVLLEASSSEEAGKLIADANLKDLDYMITDGDWIGQVEHKRTIYVRPQRIEPELKRIGNDGTFFDNSVE